MFITGLKYISRGSDYDFISTTPSQRYKLEQTKTRETARWLLGISDVTGCALHASCTTDMGKKKFMYNIHVHNRLKIYFQRFRL